MRQMACGLDRWPSGQEWITALVDDSVQFPASTWKLRTIGNFQRDLTPLLMFVGSWMHVVRVQTCKHLQTHMHEIKWIFLAKYIAKEIFFTFSYTIYTCDVHTLNIHLYNMIILYHWALILEKFSKVQMPRTLIPIVHPFLAVTTLFYIITW